MNLPGIDLEKVPKHINLTTFIPQNDLLGKSPPNSLVIPESELPVHGSERKHLPISGSTPCTGFPNQLLAPEHRASSLVQAGASHRTPMTAVILLRYPANLFDI